ncbi:C40 family peptidase [Jatrophihabitans lederbergiae]|uniref:NlpC/P60 family protein n=1 Tax=Jatrophihabitans lederbergiae TaxID=3075547 RepID=A0ABU2JG92_9ACTN|nr:NlpC/P60 family protein [Jatrophihabitans sp. DSM 44399]MDT0263766.1 NlpC/P60 family protein [Jatrophihabitans sp. DSM 44399]
MLKAAAGGIGGLLLTAALLAASAGAVASQLLGGGSPGASAPGPLALSGIPPDYLLLYQQAARTCPGLDWTVLAGIGKIETDHGQSDLPGVRSGANGAGAEGPMQFLPATFAEYSLPVPPGGQDPPSPYDPVDAINAAARMLCANGAANGQDLHAAIFAYNHSEHYVAAVVAAARAYAAAISPSGPVGGAWTPSIGQAIADRALRWLGWPYTFDGGTAAGPTYGRAVDYDSRNDASVYGFDCSGLSLYALAPWLNLDHDAATQYSQAGSVHPTNAELQPGDLVFWSNDGTVTGIGHEAIYLGQGQVVQAPHSGAKIEITPLGQVESGYYGATRPLT